MSKKNDYCVKCEIPFEFEYINKNCKIQKEHDEVACIQTQGINIVNKLTKQLLDANAEIKKLKASVNSWKDYVFELRDIIGKLWWEHPAIASDEQRAYYSGQQDRVAKLNENNN